MEAFRGYLECHSERVSFSKKKGDRKISLLSVQASIRNLVGTLVGARFFKTLRFALNDIVHFRERLHLIKPYQLIAGIVLAFLIHCDLTGTETDLKLPAGFTVTKVAGDELATNIYCLTTNPYGHVFVSGPGYIRRLIDEDNDGRFDSATDFSLLPKSGAQGIYCAKNFVLAVGDNGVWQFDDADENGVADGPPLKRMEVGTHGEHLAHAIRRGPDGWFYLIAGNATPLLPEYYSGGFSPVTEPRAGFLMRMSPDFQTQEIFAHGFRNAYDFAFNSEGQVFVYDSDGERDISLPWYRPTRVYQVQPGDDAGWVDEGWKRPSRYFDMPTEIGALGRGSPTGVESYQARQFPPDYVDAIFVADWTFGRVIVFRQDPMSHQYDQGSEFAVATGQFGFAVTDLVVAQDGSLLVSVGGRGTAGAVYRISYSSPTGTPETRKNEDVTPATFQRRLSNPYAKRADWTDSETIDILKTLSSEESELRTIALESLIGRVDSIKLDDQTSEWLIKGFKKCLNSFDVEQGKLVYRLVQASPKLQQILSDQRQQASPQTLLMLVPRREPQDMATWITNVVKELNEFPANHAQLARFAQLMLGGGGPADCPKMFKGYLAVHPIELTEEQQGFWLAYFDFAMGWEKNFGDPETVQELGRLAAMLRLNGEGIQRLMLQQIDEKSDPVEDIHWLACLAQTGSVIAIDDQREIAQRLASIDLKLSDAGLPTDRNWVPRMKELAQRLVRNTPRIGVLLLRSLNGRSGQSFLFDVIPNEHKESAIAKFAQTIESDWKHAELIQLQIVATSRSVNYQELFRTAAGHPQFQEFAISELARSPEIKDRNLFIRGLNSWNLKTVQESANAIQNFSSKPDAQEIILAFRSALDLKWEKDNSFVRDTLLRLISKRIDTLEGYEFKQPALNQSAAIQKIGIRLQRLYPILFAELMETNRNSELSAKLSEIDWQAGNRDLGEQLYRQLQCHQCHSGTSALGPRLEGVATRFSRNDLFASIVEPSRQIPDRYRATIVETIDGMIIKGAAIYDSVDGLTLQGIDGETIRVNSADIEAKSLSDKSLMPDGLLDRLSPDQWADLAAYLNTL